MTAKSETAGGKQAGKAGARAGKGKARRSPRIELVGDTVASIVKANDYRVIHENAAGRRTSTSLVGRVEQLEAKLAALEKKVKELSG